MIACSGNLASSSVAFSGPGGSAYVARSAKKMRDVWRDTPSGAMVHSSDSDIALSSCVSTPSRARHPCPSGFKLLMFLPMSHETFPRQALVGHATHHANGGHDLPPSCCRRGYWPLGQKRRTTIWVPPRH